MKKYRLTVFENRVLRRTFGPKRDEEMNYSFANGFVWV
jgi:hypothetical protein